MEKKVIHFSKFFLPAAIISSAIIIFGIVGFVLFGINLGIDFKPGFVEEVRIAPVAAEITYSGSAKITADLSKDSFDLIITGSGVENETKVYSYSEYATVNDIAKALNEVSGVSAVVKTDGTEDSSLLFVNSAVSTQLTNSPLFLYAAQKNVSADEVRDALSEFEGFSVKAIGGTNGASYQVRMPESSGDKSGADLQNAALVALDAKFGENTVTIVKTDFIGSSFSKTLASKSLILLIATFVLIWLYAAIRFHWDFALGSIIALIHDSLIMITFIVWTRMEFTATVLAAILTIVGYSINATVVILDRVRSNLALAKFKNFDEILDKSLSDTLGRSIITTVTTLFAVVALYLFTNGSIKDFSLALIVGLLSGCYSSIFISSGFISLLRRNWKPEFGVHHSLKSEKGVLQMDGIQL